MRENGTEGWSNQTNICSAIQVHGFEDGSIYVYSRSAENVTERYPDIRDSIAK